MVQYYFVYLLIFVMSFYICKNLNLYDNQILKKRINKKIAVLSGGLAIFLYLLLYVKFFSINDNLEKILVYSSFVFLIGLVDDKKELTPGIKLIFLILPILILINEGFYLDDLGTYDFGIITLGKFNLIFTILSILLLINAFNYIDGIDGLAISQFIISLSYLTFVSNDDALISLFYFLIPPLLINLFFNFNIITKIKVFLGNSGSLIIGFILAFILIYLAKFREIHPSFLIWSVFFYIYEFLSVNLVRLKKNKALFQGGKDHIHHAVFFLLGKSHFKTTILLGLFVLIVMTLMYFININTPKILSLILFFTLFFIYYFVRQKIFIYYKNN